MVTLAEELKTIITEERITPNQPFEDGFGNTGGITLAPESEEEISKILSYANKNNKTISIVSGGTKRGLGGVKEAEDILLSLKNYRGIIEHTVGDMTLTVKAGTPFQEIQDYLSQHNQKISLDPAWPKTATIGGVIAANDSGPKRLGYGSARDEVIGLRIVYPDGKVIRSGGKVVKNVAGYDMNKLFIGSLGTIGVLTEVTLKLRPTPQYESLVLLAFPGGEFEVIKRFVTELLDSALEPVSLELLSPSLSLKLTGEEVYTLAISFEDVPSSVHYQEESVTKLKPEIASIKILEREKAEHFWNEFSYIGPNSLNPNSEDIVEASLKVGVVNLDILQVIRESELLKDSYQLQVEAHGGFGHGLGHIHLKGSATDVEAAIVHLRDFANGLGGYVTVKHMPLALRQKIDVWGEKPSYFYLLEGIKNKVDPNRILNPNRFIGGI